MTSSRRHRNKVIQFSIDRKTYTSFIRTVNKVYGRRLRGRITLAVRSAILMWIAQTNKSIGAGGSDG